MTTSEPIDNVDAAIVFDPTQLELLEALRSRRTKFDFAKMYQGALQVLRQTENPLRLVLAAHGMRELMEKLPESFGELPKVGPGLKVQVGQMQDAWDRAVRNSACAQDDAWTGQIDQPLRNFLHKIGPFFRQFAADNPARKERTDAFLQMAEFRPVALPEEIRASHVNEWHECFDFFVGVAHHRRTDDGFYEWLSFLERFLLDRLVPRTHRDRQDLDDLIARGEEQ
jgi:hypothetical protein